MRTYSNFLKKIISQIFFISILTLGAFQKISASAISTTNTDVTSVADIEESTYELEPILIQVERIELPIQNVAGAFTQIDSSDISKAAHSSFSSVLANSPSMQISSTGSSAQQTSVYLRGIDSGHLLILYDGVDLGDASAIQRSAAISNFGVDNIERVEILRGNQSALYGADAIGGVINIIPKKGNESKRNSSAISSNIDVGYGSRETMNLRAGISKNGKIDASSMVGGSYNTNISIERNSTQGIPLAGAKEKSKSAKRYGHEDESLALAFGYQRPNRDTSCEFSGRFSNARTDIPRHGGVGGDDPNYQTKDKEYLAQIKVKTMLSAIFPFRLSPSITLSQNQNKRKYHNLPDNSDKTNYAGDFSGKLSKINQQNTLYLHKEHTLIAGFDFKRENANASENFDGVRSNLGQQHADTTSVYLWEKYYPVKKTFSLNSGLRLDQHQFFGSALTYKIEGRYPIWSTKIQTLPTEISLRAAHGTGFKSPTLYQLFSNFGNRDLNPERSKDYEIGIIGQVDGNHSGELNFFQNDLRQLIEYEFTTNRYKNRGQARTRGLEFVWQSHLTSTATLSTNYTYLDTKDLEKAQKLLRRATHKLSSKIDIMLTDKLIWVTEANYIGNRDDLDPITFTRIKLPAYYLFNLKFKYIIGPKISTLLQLDNIFDKSYEEVAGYGAAGRSLYAAFNLKW
ncbi:MAG: TonB-dependent receptor [Oligoflexia bacterium]|nr:TonB-dependent receptor [Oligoflexia bacterium]